MVDDTLPSRVADSVVEGLREFEAVSDAVGVSDAETDSL